nr:MAG: hypothetical protein KVP17_002208 [Porospora cf. gigantea B]
MSQYKRDFLGDLSGAEVEFSFLGKLDGVANQGLYSSLVQACGIVSSARRLGGRRTLRSSLCSGYLFLMPSPGVACDILAEMSELFR